jgi:hypothetical protein
MLFESLAFLLSSPEAVGLSNELKNVCLFVARIDGFSNEEDILKGYLLYKILIRASVTFWSEMHKWLRCRGTLF